MLFLCVLLFVVFIFPSLFLYGALLNLKTSHPYVLSRSAPSDSVVWLIAHPDDESLFFAPSILAHRSDKRHLVSLSIGDSEGEGATRQQELASSCQVLGITAEHCVSLNDTRLPDSMTASWSTEVIESLIKPYLDAWDISRIITFDSYGISGHINHQALSTLSLPKCTLQSAFVPAKFSHILTVPYLIVAHFLHNADSAKEDSHLYLSDPWQYLIARDSFKQHASQQRWFRDLYVGLSRYMWVNQVLCSEGVRERELSNRDEL